MIVLIHLIREVINLLSRVAINNCLSDGECLIQILESIKLPLFLLNGNIELTNTFKGKFSSLLTKIRMGIAHEFACQLYDLLWHSSREKSNLHVTRQQLKDIIDLLLETMTEHLIGLVNDENLQIIESKRSLRSHIVTHLEYNNQMFVPRGASQHPL